MWESVLTFLSHYWFSVAMIIWLFYFTKRCGTGWIKEQIDWFKGMFYDDDDGGHPDAPNHKNAIFIALAVVFIISFLKKLTFGTSDEIPDIPIGWQMILLGGLGIAAAKTGAQKLFENKWNPSNGNGDEGKQPPPTP